MSQHRPLTLFSFLLALCLPLSCASSLAQDEVTSLAPWQGTWNSAESFLGEEVFQDAYAALAETMDMPAEAVQAMLTGMMQAGGVGSFVITDEEIAAYADRNGEGDLLFRAAFAYNGKKTVTGEFQGISFTADWYQFALQGDGPEAYTYLVLGEVEAEEGSLVHCHYRFGAESVDALTGMTEDWYPTMCDPSVTAESLLAELLSGE